MFTLHSLAYRASPFIIIASIIFSPAMQAEDKADWAFSRNVHIEEERVLDAVVEAVNQATISAQTSGRVVKLNADIDDAVKQAVGYAEKINKNSSYHVSLVVGAAGEETHGFVVEVESRLKAVSCQKPSLSLRNSQWVKKLTVKM